MEKNKLGLTYSTLKHLEKINTATDSTQRNECQWDTNESEGKTY